MITRRLPTLSMGRLRGTRRIGVAAHCRDNEGVRQPLPSALKSVRSRLASES